jgi:hypoxanthine-DNA glycosylase
MTEFSTGFPPIAAPQAHTLILGSMPGVKSLKQQQYYAHPRNAFWPIMAKLLKLDSQADYSSRCTQITNKGIAVWDVLQQCQRQGSLDQDIKKESMVHNDFALFLTEHEQITRIFFNGGTAEQLFQRYVFKTLPASKQDLSMIRLPSTSPAHASMTFEQKLEQWKVINLH